MNITEADLNFTEGINVLHGENGQGKSAVLEAIAYCCVGRTRGSSWKDYVKNGTESFDIHLELTKTDGREDLITFDYKGDLTSGTVSKKIQYHGETYIGEKANKFLEEIFDLKMLENTVFSMQDGTAISDMTASERRDIFAKIFNSSFDSIVDKIKEDLEASKAEEQKFSAQIEVLKSNKYVLYENIIDPDPSIITQLSAELESVQASEVVYQKYRFFQEKKRVLGTLKTNLESIILKREVSQKAVEAIKLSDGPILETKKLLVSQLKEFAVQLEVLEDTLETQQKQLDNTKLTRAEQYNSYTTNKEKLSLLIQEERTKQAELNGLITVANKHIEAHKKGECETCGQKTDALNIPQFEAEISGYRNSIESSKTSCIQYEKDIQDNKTKIANIDIQIASEESSVSFTKQSIAEIEKAIASREASIKLKNQELASITDKISVAQERVNEIEADSVKVTQEVTELSLWCDTNLVEEPVALERGYDMIKKDIENTIAEIQKAKAQREQNEITKNKEKEDKQRISAIAEDLNKIQLSIKGLKEIQKIYSDQFPSFINLKACTILQSYMNGFFETVKDGFVVHLQQSKKGVEFLYRAKDEKEWNPVSMLSGFEKALLNLGFKIAIAKAYGSTTILLDEPDAAASEESSERVFKTVTDVGGFEQMFVITHKAVAMDYLRDNGARVYSVSAGEFSLAG